MPEFTRVKENEIAELSLLATQIVREHFDPIIGSAQNDYMLQKFQSEGAIRNQIQSGYRYYWVVDENTRKGFLAFFPKAGAMYLSKFYIAHPYRGNHLAKAMVDFLVEETRKEGLPAIRLNVNRDNSDVIAKYMHMGFGIIGEEKNDIGAGFCMDDYVMRLEVDQSN